MTSLINNPLFSGISAEVLSDDLKDVNYHTKVYRKGDILALSSLLKEVYAEK